MRCKPKSMNETTGKLPVFLIKRDKLAIMNFRHVSLPLPLLSSWNVDVMPEVGATNLQP